LNSLPAKRLAILLLLLQAVATIFLWTLDALNEISEGIFALFLAANLVSFAMISYLYRHEKEAMNPSRLWLAIGGILIVVFLFVSLALA
jgi:O-antigen/teichoic acid export membrane protein